MRETGRLDEAERLQLEALAIRTELFGDDHRQVAFSKNNLAGVYRLQGRYQLAQTSYEEALGYWRGLDNKPVDMAFPLLGLGQTLTESGKAGEALPYIQEALALREAHFEADDLLVAEARAALGRCLSMQGQTEEANDLLVQALDTFKESDKLDDRRALEINQWLNDLQ